ncbi:MAG: 4Fe-4S dicluster domain-containing protein [Candidatus Omnitrophica bacterium]|nr:4Fe-4S dicluster domain-containing protein [Candidatus Omnitrophota bacterium]
MKKYISYKNLINLLNVLAEDYQVFVPTEAKNGRFYKKYSADCGKIVIGEVRAVEPLKSFFLPGRERVAEDFKPDLPQKDGRKPYAVVGVKACDLKGFKVQDYVFKDHDFEDPFYNKARQNNLIISADCTCCLESCFCIALNLKPYPQESFDINLSQVDAGFVAETGTQRGENIVKENFSLFEDAQDYMISERNQQREKVAGEIKANIKTQDIPQESLYQGIIGKNYQSALWQDEAKACVECGACNTICPTCHCFLLYDQKDKGKMMRLRIWDSCMIKDFARVAGGANPRERLWMRLRNRFEKKFDYFPKVSGIYACTGCGRCIAACPAKIDIRKVLKRLVDGR